VLIGQSKLKLLSGNQKLTPACRRLQHYNNPVFVEILVNKNYNNDDDDDDDEIILISFFV